MFEDDGRAAYSQLCLHLTGEYNYQQAGISCYIVIKLLNMLHAVQFTHSESHLCSRMHLQKLEIFARVLSKMHCEHATAFSHLHERC